MGLIKRGPRFEVTYDSVLVDSEGEPRDVRVTDISRDGCRIESAAPLRIGEQVLLRLGQQGDQKAQIRWALGTQAGAAFARPLELDD